VGRVSGQEGRAPPHRTPEGKTRILKILDSCPHVFEMEKLREFLKFAKAPGSSIISCCRFSDLRFCRRVSKLSCSNLDVFPGSPDQSPPLTGPQEIPPTIEAQVTHSILT
jgi:hypothetical protein